MPVWLRQWPQTGTLLRSSSGALRTYASALNQVTTWQVSRTDAERLVAADDAVVEKNHAAAPQVEPLVGLDVNSLDLDAPVGEFPPTGAALALDHLPSRVRPVVAPPTAFGRRGGARAAIATTCQRRQPRLEVSGRIKDGGRLRAAPRLCLSSPGVLSSGR